MPWIMRCLSFSMDGVGVILLLLKKKKNFQVLTLTVLVPTLRVHGNLLQA